MTVWQRRIWLALWPAGIAAVVAGDLGFILNGTRPRETLPLDISVGAFSVVAGLIAWRRRPDNKIGLLLYLSGIAWALGGLGAYRNSFTFPISQILGNGGQDPILAHALIAYPTGKIRSGWQRALVIVFYGLFPAHIVQALTFGPRTCACAVKNAFMVWDSPSAFNIGQHVGDVLGATAILGVAIIVARWIRATPTGRRVYTPVLAGGLLFAGTATASFFTTLGGGDEPGWSFYSLVVAHVLLPVTFLFGLLRGTLERFGVGDFVVRLGVGHGPESLQQALARALKDPSVEVAYWIPERDGYVDAGARAVVLPAGDQLRVATIVERDGERLAVIIHDRAVLENPALVESVTAAARLALDNERLQAAVRAQLEEVRASRARIVQASDEARRRIERDLHDGAQQRLLALSLSLRMAKDRLGQEGDPLARKALEEAEGEMRVAIAELRELAQGIHPAILTERGLAAAIEALAERAPLPVRVDVSAERYPTPVEATAYFLVSEGLSNVFKYSTASHARVSARHAGGHLFIEVADDGVGGADEARGSGLRGLSDRVAALGGRLEVESPSGGGTCVRAEIPCT